MLAYWQMAGQRMRQGDALTLQELMLLLADQAILVVIILFVGTAFRIRNTRQVD